MRLEVRGAPRDQGIEQGERLREAVRAALQAAPGDRGPLHPGRRAPRAGRAVERFLPQLHERLEGIAAGAGVRLRALERCEALATGARAYRCGPALAAALEPGLALAPWLTLRRSAPDAGGFPSAELTAAPWSSCIGGVNAEGLAALGLAEGSDGAPRLRWLAQDVLLRTRSLETALEHVRRRARYLGSNGSLLLADSRLRLARLELVGGALVEVVRDERACPDAGADAPWSLALEPAEAAVRWRDAAGIEEKLVAS